MVHYEMSAALVGQNTCTAQLFQKGAKKVAQRATKIGNVFGRAVLSKQFLTDVRGLNKIAEAMGRAKHQ